MRIAAALLPLFFLSAHAIADDAATFRAALAEQAATLAKTEAPALKTSAGHYFLTRELRHYSLGPFWGDDAAKTSRAAKNQDPAVAILDFHAQCQKAGVTLILVPVPGKTVLYPDQLVPTLRPDPRLDTAHAAFYDSLRKAGFHVVDLTPALLKQRQAGADTHCRQDTHWSPAAVKLAAKEIAAIVREQPFYKDHPRFKIDRESRAIDITGDLAALLQEANTPPEKITVEQITRDGKPIASDPQSPVVLIGDSHAIVYHQPIDGGINAQHAGLFDHLAAELGLAPEMLAVLGSGANASRLDLARRKDNLANKKVIVWCFAASEFTESAQGWLKLPVVR